MPPRPPSGQRSSGRVLGVDVGTVRVGLAMSDATGTLASPLETLKRAKDGSDLDRLAALVVEHEVTEVVVGEPVHLSGASGTSAQDAADTVLAGSASVTDTVAALRKAGYAPIRQNAQGETVVERVPVRRVDLRQARARYPSLAGVSPPDLAALALRLAGMGSA